MSKVGRSCMHFLLDTFGGSHDGTIRALATAAGSATQILWASATHSSDFSKSLPDIVRLLGMHKQVVGMEANAPPELGARQLRRWGLEAELDRDPGRKEQITKERRGGRHRARDMRRKEVRDRRGCQKAIAPRMTSGASSSRTPAKAAYTFARKAKEAPVRAALPLLRVRFFPCVFAMPAPSRALATLCPCHTCALRGRALCHALATPFANAMLLPLLRRRAL